MTEAEKKYADIINLERPVHDGDAFSRAHPKMELEKRAKIFLPFDALRGFKAEVDIIQERDGREEIERSGDEYEDFG